MPHLDVQTTDEIPSPKEGMTYEITKVEEFQSQVRSFAGIRVIMKDDKGEEVITALWKRTPIGPKSELGAFITKLGKDTETWIGKRITFISWKPSNRVIELAIPARKGK